MTEKILTDSEAAALHGTTDDNTDAAYPSLGLKAWGNARARFDNRLIAAVMLANACRVFQVDGDTDAIGVRAGRVRLAGQELTYAEQDPAIASLTDNDTTYVWLEDAGSGAAQVDSAIDATGWPLTPHIKLAEVTVVSGAITAIVDRRSAMILDQDAAYTLSIETQGSTGGASRIHIEGAGATDYLRVRVANFGAFANATNATIAAAGSSSLVETITAGKDLVFKSDANGLFEIDLTDATAETVTVQIGPAPLRPRRSNYTATLNVTHA